MEKNKSFKAVCEMHTQKSNIKKHCIAAFSVGGIMSFCGEIFSNILLRFGIEEKESYLYVTLIFILLASTFTSLGLFDKLAVFAGAGTLVPVTGFSNAVTSCAIDARSEGYVSGVGTKIFTVAGPVILYSSLAGFLYGLVYFIYTIFV
ncbi:MAG: SpoVA/SpoVAEb family sporulation membrane protein [Clostridia bacterium]|nr:SpoVA/SpoVAEb family sporulation membrane protein [Clostridia bacterium]